MEEQETRMDKNSVFMIYLWGIVLLLRIVVDILSFSFDYPTYIAIAILLFFSMISGKYIKSTT